MADFQQGRINLLDRLKRRVNKYRDHSTISKCHFENTVESIYGDQHKQTLLLKQRHIESKVKKNNKKSDKKLDSSSLLSNMGQSKLLARGHDQASGSGEGQDNSEPAAKKQRIANGSMVTSVSADISDFQIVQQLHNIKNRSSPNVPSTSNTTVATTNNITTPSLNCSDPLEALSDSVLGTEGDDSIKKENDLDIPNDSLLEDFGELSNFEDIDMGINLEDFVHDLDLDNIKHENSNPGMDPFFKEEIVDNLFDDPSNISTDSGVVNGSSNGQLGNQSKVSSSTASPVYPPYSNTPPASLCSTATSFSSNSFSSSLPSQPFSSIATSSSLSTPFTMTSDLAKIRVNASNNITMGQNDMVLAAQTLKQMAEQHQTKLSPTGNVARSAMSEFNSYNNLGGNSMMTQSPSPSVMTQSSSMITQSASLPSHMHNSSINQMSPLYNQNLGNDMEMKRRQQMMQQYSMQQQMQHQTNAGLCNQVGSQSHSQNMQQSQPQQQQQQQQSKQVQHQSQIQSQPSQTLQVQNQQLHQQTHQSPTQLSQQIPQIQQHSGQLSQQTGQLSQQTGQHLQQTQQQQQQQQQVPQPQQQQQTSQVSQQQQQSQLQQQTQQQSQLQHQTQQQAQNQVQQASQQSQMRNSLSPFSNRMSPMSSYSHSQQSPNQMGMSPQYANTICSGMTSNSIRSPYSTPTRGTSPIPQVPQNQPSNMSVPTANQPRYMQQQMMGSVGMMRPQMMPQSNQIIARGPPPEYRHPVMMQQHQAMMSQSMTQSMPQLHQGMGQMTFQGMRPGYRPSMGGSPLGTMSGGQMMGGMNQQSIPANIPNMKGSMVQGNGMSTVTMGGAMGQGSVCPSSPMSGNGMSVSMNQVTGGGNMGMVSARPTMIQRTRPPNVNMGMPGLGMGTQMPPSRPEWRQIMMQQNPSGMMMGPGIRHGYQQVQQSGTMIAQGGQMMPMQRSQAHMMNMMGMQSSPAMQHGAGMGATGHPMQGNGTMPTHTSQSMQSMALGGRMQQHSLPSMGQGQVHLGMQMSQQSMQDSRNTTSMSQAQHVGSPSSMTQMGASPSTTMVHHGNPIGHSGMSPINSGGGVNPNLNHMSSTNISSLVQQGGGNSTTVNALASNASTMSGITAHPRSPATMGQMHPCSPVSSGAGGGPQRPLSNPSLGISTQGQNSDSSQTVSGNCSPLLVCSSSAGILSTQTQGRQTVGSNLASIRTTNPNHGSQSLGGMLGSQVTGQQGQSLNPNGNNISSTQSVMIGNKNSGSGGNGGTPTVQRPESRGGGGTSTKTEPPISNPPSNSGSNDFDLMFNEGEFAALLN